MKSDERGEHQQLGSEVIQDTDLVALELPVFDLVVVDGIAERPVEFAEQASKLGVGPLLALGEMSLQP